MPTREHQAEARCRSAAHATPAPRRVRDLRRRARARSPTRRRHPWRRPTWSWSGSRMETPAPSPPALRCRAGRYRRSPRSPRRCPRVSATTFGQARRSSVGRIRPSRSGFFAGCAREGSGAFSPSAKGISATPRSDICSPWKIFRQEEFAGKKASHVPITDRPQYQPVPAHDGLGETATATVSVSQPTRQSSAWCRYPAFRGRRYGGCWQRPNNCTAAGGR